VPHFYPAPALPNRIKSSNYDKGGEGVAYHKNATPTAKSGYRPDDLGLVETTDVGGGFALAGLQSGEWVRYTLDAVRGGYFDLSVRVAAAQAGGRFRLVALDQIADVTVPATGGDDTFADLRFPNVYLNPGENTLMVYAESPGFVLRTLDFAAPAQAPATYAAALGRRSGYCEVIEPGTGGTHKRGLLDKLGKVGSGLELGVMAPADGPRKLRFRYRNQSGQPVALKLTIGTAEPRTVEFPVAGDWTTLDVPTALVAGGNRVVLEGEVKTWAAITLDTIELTAL
jgi:hypothetical protein